MSAEEFYRVAESLNARKVIGRFSTFLEHVKPSATGVRVTRFNALFIGRCRAAAKSKPAAKSAGIMFSPIATGEGRAGISERHIMAVAHGTDKELLLEHKRAIDRHLESCGLPVSYTNVFWGGRSEIKPSEISPQIYRAWRREMEEVAAR